LFRAYGKIGEGQTDMTKLIIAVHNFANAPKTVNIDMIWVLT
jgi:hypothetical protein